MFKFKRTLHTNGKGYWTATAASVKVTMITVDYVNDEGDFGELRVHFDTKSWDCNTNGLIYTDPKFLRELRKALIAAGFSAAAADDADYSEQGMQGDDYVSLDIGKKFLKEWQKTVDNLVPSL